MNSTKQPNKFTRFLRNNAALLLLIFCVLAITAVVLAVTLTGKSNNPVPDNPVVEKPGNDDNKDPEPVVKDKVKVYFAKPLNYTSVGMEHVDGKDVLFVSNITLGGYCYHKGVDLLATDGTDVAAMYDGTVIDVKNTFEMGYEVIIDHGDNVVATYASLGDVQVVKGQNVKQGDKLGVASTTASNEFMDGAHVHLEIAKDGKAVDPMPYVRGEIFREVEQD